MAYDGELVKMQDGRWARFQRCQLWQEDGRGEPTMLLIAVELEDRHQELLDEVSASLAHYRQQGIAVQAEVDEQARRVTLHPEAQPAPVVH